MRNVERVRRSRGFASVIAISMVALMAMAMAAIMWRFKEGVIDARAQSQSAELRQLLIAGGAASPKVVTESLPELNLPLPQSLTDRGASVLLILTPPEGDLERQVQVQARLNGVTARQNLRYGRTSKGWALIGAALNPKAPQ